jgi:DNA-binding CsgD family transcriptional regulator
MTSERHPDSESPSKISYRQRQIWIQMSAGKSNREIADTLFISEKTVKSHVTLLFKYLGVKTRLEAVVKFYTEKSPLVPQ